MYAIQGARRAQLAELVRQLDAHGPGGGSAALTAAMLGKATMHDLARHLADDLLGLQVGGGGAGHQHAIPAAVTWFCPTCGSQGPGSGASHICQPTGARGGETRGVGAGGADKFLIR